MGTQNLLNVAKTDNIVALCDCDESQAAKDALKRRGTLEKFPKAKQHKDFRKMLETQKDFDAVRVKFGVPAQAPQGGRGGGGGGRGGGAPDPNLLNRLAAAKGAVMGIWEAPSGAVSRQAASARTGLLAAITEAEGVLARARTMASALKAHNITLNVQ